MEFHFDQTPDDELELAALRTTLLPENRSDWNGEESLAPTLADRGRDVGDPNLPTRGEHDHALDEVTQLADVPWPPVVHERLNRLGRDSVEDAIMLLRELLNEAAHEQRDVLASLTQRGEIDPQDVQAIEEVGSEVASLDALAEWAIRRGDHADIHRDRLRPTDARDLPLLEYPQQLYLRARRDLTDLVEEERAPTREFEASDPSLGGPGERAFLMTEEFALEQGLGERPDVHRDEGLVATR